MVVSMVLVVGVVVVLRLLLLLLALSWRRAKVVCGWVGDLAVVVVLVLVMSAAGNCGGGDVWWKMGGDGVGGGRRLGTRVGGQEGWPVDGGWVGWWVVGLFHGSGGSWWVGGWAGWVAGVDGL